MKHLITPDMLIEIKALQAKKPGRVVGKHPALAAPYTKAPAVPASNSIKQMLDHPSKK